MALSLLSPVSGYPSVCATINCLYCKAVLSFSGLPAVRYADHLSQEHRILFEQVTNFEMVVLVVDCDLKLYSTDNITYSCLLTFQDDIIARTIQSQLKGLLPPAYVKPSPRISTIVSLVARIEIWIFKLALKNNFIKPCKNIAVLRGY